MTLEALFGVPDLDQLTFGHVKRAVESGTTERELAEIDFKGELYRPKDPTVTFLKVELVSAARWRGDELFRSATDRLLLRDFIDVIDRTPVAMRGLGRQPPALRVTRGLRGGATRQVLGELRHFGCGQPPHSGPRGR